MSHCEKHNVNYLDACRDCLRENYDTAKEWSAEQYKQNEILRGLIDEGLAREAALREDLIRSNEVAEHNKSLGFDLQQAVAALREELATAHAQSVTNIMMDIVPGFDGMGEEIYAKSVADVQLLISNLYLETEEQEQRLEDAERKNMELEGLLRDTETVLSNELSYELFRKLGNHFERIKAALTKPEEAKS